MKAWTHQDIEIIPNAGLARGLTGSRILRRIRFPSQNPSELKILRTRDLLSMLSFTESNMRILINKIEA